MTRLRLVVGLLILAAPALFASDGRYWVALRLQPDQELNAVANEVASIARGRVESIDEGASAFVLVTSDSAVRTIQTLPAVAGVQPADDPYTAPRRPALAVPNGTTTWTTGTYAYDGSGNIKSITRDGQTDQFFYDAFGRVTSGTAGPGQMQEYTYDSYGNIKTKKTNGTTITYGVDAATNRVSVSGQSNAWGTYDAAGRLTSRPLSDSFTYDGLDVVTQATVDSVTKVYLYNASDERVASFTVENNFPTAAEWTIRALDGKVLRRFSTAGNGALAWREDYIYRGAQLLASEVDQPEKRRFFHLDHLGTPRLITGNGGEQLSAHTYLPFGEEVTPAGTEALKFTGHERDAASLDYMHARYYATTWGRFLSPDPGGFIPTKPQSWNRYAYVENNPVNRIDPDGRECPPCLAEAIQYVGMAATMGSPLTYLSAYNEAVVNTVAPPPPAQNGSIEPTYAEFQIVAPFVPVAAPEAKVAASAASQEEAAVASQASTLSPGPHAGESIPARGPQPKFTTQERAEINRIGSTSGCHTCGSPNPGTKSGNWVPDHQPSSALNPPQQRLYPHCIGCSRRQGGEVRQLLKIIVNTFLPLI